MCLGRPWWGEIDLGGHVVLGLLGGVHRVLVVVHEFLGGRAYIAVAYEACAIGDDEGACGEVALDLRVCSQGELAEGDDWSGDLAVNDD